MNAFMVEPFSSRFRNAESSSTSAYAAKGGKSVMRTNVGAVHGKARAIRSAKQDISPGLLEAAALQRRLSLRKAKDVFVERVEGRHGRVGWSGSRS